MAVSVALPPPGYRVCTGPLSLERRSKGHWTVVRIIAKVGRSVSRAADPVRGWSGAAYGFGDMNTKMVNRSGPGFRTPCSMPAGASAMSPAATALIC